jgi:membrane protease YdiL (CAAX protease family)
VVVRSNGKLAGWLAFVAVLSVLNYAGRFAGSGDTPDDLLYDWSTAIFGVIQYAVIAGIMLLIARGLPRRDAFALHRPQSWGAALGLCFAAFIAMLALAAATRPFFDPGEEQGLVPDQWDSSRAAPFVANAIVVVVLAPIIEELTFRGLGFTLLERFGRWAAIVLVGLAFAAVHGLVEGFLLLAVFGALLALIRSRSGSIYPPILLHAFFNGFALLGSLLV